MRTSGIRRQSAKAEGDDAGQYCRRELERTAYRRKRWWAQLLGPLSERIRDLTAVQYYVTARKRHGPAPD